MTPREDTAMQLVETLLTLRDLDRKRTRSVPPQELARELSFAVPTHQRMSGLLRRLRSVGLTHTSYDPISKETGWYVSREGMFVCELLAAALAHSGDGAA